MRLYWISDDGQSSLDMGSCEDWVTEEGRKKIEEIAWEELKEQGHDMTGRMVWL